MSDLQASLNEASRRLLAYVGHDNFVRIVVHETADAWDEDELWLSYEDAADPADDVDPTGDALYVRTHSDGTCNVRLDIHYPAGGPATVYSERGDLDALLPGLLAHLKNGHYLRYPAASEPATP